MASFSTSCCQHQFWRLPCLQKKFDAQKLREQKCLPLCLVVIRRFLSNILWEEKSYLWKLHGGATCKSTFCEFFFSQSKFFANTFRNMPFDLEHSKNVTKHKLHRRAGGWGDLIDEVIICQKWPKMQNEHFRGKGRSAGWDKILTFAKTLQCINYLQKIIIKSLSLYQVERRRQRHVLFVHALMGPERLEAVQDWGGHHPPGQLTK